MKQSKDSKKQDFLKAIFNVKEYTKNLKKNASNLADPNNYAVYSQDEIQTFNDFQSTKNPHSFMESSYSGAQTSEYQQKHVSTNFFPQNQRKKSSPRKSPKKSNKMGAQDPMAQSGGDAFHFSPPKMKKASHSYMQKSLGSIINLSAIESSQNIDLRQNPPKEMLNQFLHQSLGSKRTETVKRIRSIINVNNMDIQSGMSSIKNQGSPRRFKDSPSKVTVSPQKEYEKRKKSEVIVSTQNPHKKSNQVTQIPTKSAKGSIVKAESKNKAKSEYILSEENFLKLLRKVEEQEATINLYQSCIKSLKERVLELERKQKEYFQKDFLIESLKEDIIDHKDAKSNLKERLFEKDRQINEYETTMLKSIRKIVEHYQQQCSKIVGIQRQNKFYKQMLNFEVNDQIEAKPFVNKFEDDSDDEPQHNLHLSVNSQIDQLKSKSKFNGEKDKSRGGFA